MKRSVKIAVYVGLWLAALLATDLSLGLWSLAWMFPLGLWGFFDYRGANSGGWGVMITGYFVYLIHAVLYFRAQTRHSFVVLVILLAVLLTMNAAGCHAMNTGRH